MKTKIAILALVFAAASATAYGAPSSGMNLKISGGSEDDVFRVTVSSDGRTYDIESNVSLEADSSICWSSEAPGKFELHCWATAIAGFEISGGAGSDLIELPHVPVPGTLIGGTEGDTLVGGLAADKILGGPGKDFIAGNGGTDELLGEGGDDRIVGGGGGDRLKGGGGEDALFGGTGGDSLFGGVGGDRLSGGPSNDLLVGGGGVDLLSGGPGHNVLRQ
jgi:Ca2+-binding RTX toxin-like protein